MFAFVKDGKFLKFKLKTTGPCFIEVDDIENATTHDSIETIGLGELRVLDGDIVELDSNMKVVRKVSTDEVIPVDIGDIV